MKRRFSTMALLVICASGVSLGAQVSKEQATAKTGATQALSGCLQSSRADTTTADPKGVIYTLDVAESPAAPATGATAGSSSARAAAVAKTRYSLSADPSMDLSKHVGHHVQLTGRLQPPPGKDQASTGAGAKPLPGAAHRMFQVTGLKMIAAKCP